MNSARDNPMPDMNIPSNLDFYRQIIELEHDTSKEEILFNDLDHSQQRALMAIAHSRNFEYEYHQGCARVFRTQNFESQINFSPSSPGRTISGMLQSSRHPLPTPTSPQPAVRQTGVASSKSDESAPLPALNSMAMPMYSGQAEAQSIFRTIFLRHDFDPLSNLEAPDPAISAPFMDFSGVQRQYGVPYFSPVHQQMEMDISLLPMESTHPADETGSLLGSTYPNFPTDDDSFGLVTTMVSPSMSDPSAIGNPSRLAAMPAFDDFSSIKETFAYNDEWPQYSHVSRGSSFTSATPLSQLANAGSGFQTHKPASRSASVSSLQSERGRNRISKLFRKSSNASMKSPGAGEFIFDSSQVRSSSRASSGRSVRTGPLDYLARAGMKAVRAIGGACWRCKILGKKCSDESPCDSCPKRSTAEAGLTPWKAVGCRRGTLREEMEPVNLCPRSQGEQSQSRDLPAPAGDQGTAPRSPPQKKLKCPYCQERFAIHRNLKSHVLAHSQEKPYVCPTCTGTIRFRRLHDLKRHMKLHNGERPYICSKCNRRFARGDALARHVKGQGGCAGRKASTGSFREDDAFEGSTAGVRDGGAMDGILYRNGAPSPDHAASEGDSRGFSHPSIEAQPMSSGGIVSLKQASDGVSSLHFCKHGIPLCLECVKVQDDQTTDIGQRGQAFLDAAIHRRREDITNEGALLGDRPTILGPVLHALRAYAVSEDLGLTQSTPSSPYYPLASLIPLDQCILAIIWEALGHSDYLSIISIFDRGDTALAHFVVLMRSAAIYQARLEEDSHQLIAQSLICLRESLEVVQAERLTRELIDPAKDCHRRCSSTSQCQVAYVANLNATLARYIDQLSCVFFKKENLRGKTWWLSVYYSLVIQSVVRKLILSLVNHLPVIHSSIKRYLHLAVRLFIASSGEYDPLTREWDISNPQSSEEELAEIESFVDAKLAVGQKDWKSLGIRNSGDYLQKLFEDDGSPIAGREVDDSDLVDTVSRHYTRSRSFSIESPHSAPLMQQQTPFLEGSMFSPSMTSSSPPLSSLPHSSPHPFFHSFARRPNSPTLLPDLGNILPSQQIGLSAGTTDSGDHPRWKPQKRPQPQCWEHGCNGQLFSTFSSLLKHQRTKSEAAQKRSCRNCGVKSTGVSTKDWNLLHDKCKPKKKM